MISAARVDDLDDKASTESDAIGEAGNALESTSLLLLMVVAERGNSISDLLEIPTYKLSSAIMQADGDEVVSERELDLHSFRGTFESVFYVVSLLHQTRLVASCRSQVNHQQTALKSTDLPPSLIHDDKDDRTLNKSYQILDQSSPIFGFSCRSESGRRKQVHTRSPKGYRKSYRVSTSFHIQISGESLLYRK